MHDREKLIELLRVQIYPHLDADPYEVIADHLIANGVTVPQWIPVSERLPEANTRVLAYRPGQFYEMVVVTFDGYHWERWDTADGADRSLITHWMPLPEPPKEVCIHFRYKPNLRKVYQKN